MPNPVYPNPVVWTGVVVGSVSGLPDSSQYPFRLDSNGRLLLTGAADPSGTVPSVQFGTPQGSMVTPHGVYKATAPVLTPNASYPMRTDAQGKLLTG